MLAAYTNKFEQSCLDAVRNLMLQGASWEVMPPYARTSSMLTRAFLMLSGIGCLCWQLLVAHKGYPFCMFGLLLDTEAAGRIMHDCEHRRDAWSQAFIDHHSGRPEGLKSPDVQAELLHSLHIARRETCQIEAMHASVRRALMSNSVQTHALMFQHVSAHFITQKARKIGRKPRRKRALQDDAQPAEGSRQGQTAQQRNQQKHRQKQHRRRRPGYGGAWRAFIRQEAGFARGSPDFAELGERYRNLPGEELARLAAVGARATAAGRAGDSTPFGPRPAQVHRREAKRRRTEAIADAMSREVGIAASSSELTLTSRAPIIAVAEAPPVAEETPAARLLALRSRFRAEAGAAAQVRRQTEEAVMKYLNGKGGQMIDELAEAPLARGGQRSQFCSLVPLFAMECEAVVL